MMHFGTVATMTMLANRAWRGLQALTKYFTLTRACRPRQEVHELRGLKEKNLNTEAKMCQVNIWRWTVR